MGLRSSPCSFGSGALMGLCIHDHGRGWWQCLGINVHFGHVSFNPLGNDTICHFTEKSRQGSVQILKLGPKSFIRKTGEHFRDLAKQASPPTEPRKSAVTFRRRASALSFPFQVRHAQCQFASMPFGKKHFALSGVLLSGHRYVPVIANAFRQELQLSYNTLIPCRQIGLQVRSSL